MLFVSSIARRRSSAVLIAALAALLAVFAVCALTAEPAQAAAPKSITAANVSTGKLVLVKGKSYKIGATVSPAAASKKLGYKSSKKSVATVSSKGTIKAKGYGKATIAVWSKSKKSVKKKITVKVVKKSAYKKAKKTVAIKVIAPAIVKKGMSGTCAWTLDEDGLLIIKPAHGTSGTLGMVDVVLDEEGSTRPAYPWRDRSFCDKVKSAKVLKGVSGDADGTSLYDLFSHCKNLVSVDLSGLNTSKLEVMSYMFWDCTSLKSITWPTNLNTAHVTEMSSMFDGCKSLKTLKLPASFDTSNVEYMDNMFYACSLLTLDCSGWNVSYVVNADSFADGAPGVVEPNWGMTM